MGHYKHKDIGNLIADRFGYSGETIHSVLEKMPADGCLLAVLVSILHDTRDIRRYLVEIADAIKRGSDSSGSSNGHPFDGLNLADRSAQFNWNLVAVSGLSVRARTVLRRMKEKGVVDVNETSLSEAKGCGEMTKREVMRWIKAGCPKMM